MSYDIRLENVDYEGMTDGDLDRIMNAFVVL
jgi:hypothetical protein